MGAPIPSGQPSSPRTVQVVDGPNNGTTSVRIYDGHDSCCIHLSAKGVQTLIYDLSVSSALTAETHPDFEVGDRVVIVGAHQVGLWKGLLAEVCTYDALALHRSYYESFSGVPLRPLADRPDTLRRAPFVWSADDLLKVRGA